MLLREVVGRVDGPGRCEWTLRPRSRAAQVDGECTSEQQRADEEDAISRARQRLRRAIFDHAGAAQRTHQHVGEESGEDDAGKPGNQADQQNRAVGEESAGKTAKSWKTMTLENEASPPARR